MNPALDTLVQEFNQLVAERVSVSPPVAAPVAERVSVSPASAPAVTAAPAPATAPTPAAPAAPAPAPSPVQTPDFALKGYHLDVTVAADQVVASARILDRAGFCLDTITGVDWLAQNEMEVVYDYLHFSSPLRVVIRTRLPRANPEVPTILEVFPGANWHERETHDFFGIRFLGHPNLKPFLLPEDADFHPLRKDYKP
jgi:NADH-quinone oxidoreductase subunit C